MKRLFSGIRSLRAELHPEAGWLSRGRITSNGRQEGPPAARWRGPWENLASVASQIPPAGISAATARPVHSGRVAIALVGLASALVIAVCTLSGFRLGFADDLPTLVRVNGPSVLPGAAAGGALALASGAAGGGRR